jgi:signal transduction histidine kinase
MAAVGYTSRAGSFLVALLRGGAAVIGDVPPDLPDQAVDPDPQPGWRRMSVMTASTGVPRTDSLLVRATRYIVLLPLMYRVVVTPVLLLGFLSGAGSLGTSSPAGLAAVYAVAAFTVLCNVGSVVWLLRVPGLRGSVARPLLWADAAVAIAVNVIIALVVPDPQFSAAVTVSWLYLLGAVALWALAWGVPAGLFLVAVAVPLHVLMGLLGGADRAAWSSTTNLVADVLGLLAALLTSVVVLLLIGLATRLALGVGIRRGREAEQARAQRLLHDTVLQVLETMAMPLPGRPADLETALAELAELRGIARAQALELRRGLNEAVENGGTGLGGDLAALAAEMAREGLRAQLVFADIDDGTLSEARRLAVRDAAREAMRNTMKHAGTTEVVLRVEQRDGGIAVIARDHGEGFSEAERPPGFGISHSISGRLSEVGGSALIESNPGHGTRVTLWVPL